MNKKVLLSGVTIGGALLSLLVPEVASAAGVALGTIGDNVAISANGLGKAVKAFALLIGLGLVVGGIIGLATHKKTNTPISYAILALVAGIMLTSISAVIGSGSQTLFNSDTSELSKIQLN